MLGEYLALCNLCVAILCVNNDNNVVTIIILNAFPAHPSMYKFYQLLLLGLNLLF